MLESKRKRGPTRTPQEKLEDAFMDLPISDQVKALETFQTLHRMKVRLFSEKWTAITADDRCQECGHLTGTHSHSCKLSQGSLIDEPATETGTKP